MSERRPDFPALLLDDQPEAVIALSRTHEIVFWNRAAESMFGYTREEALHRPVAELLFSHRLASLSHELRTPLNAIIGFAELMHDGKVGPVASEQKEFLGDILTSSRQLLRLIDDRLELAKAEAGKRVRGDDDAG